MIFLKRHPRVSARSGTRTIRGLAPAGSGTSTLTTSPTSTTTARSRVRNKTAGRRTTPIARTSAAGSSPVCRRRPALRRARFRRSTCPPPTCASRMAGRIPPRSPSASATAAGSVCRRACARPFTTARPTRAGRCSAAPPRQKCSTPASSRM